MLEPRPVREPLGESLEPALRADSAHASTLADLTRSGWTNPAGVSRSTLQRVTYRLQDNKLKRDYWTVLDRTLDRGADQRGAARQGAQRRRCDSWTRIRRWHEQWPPLGYSGAGRRAPAADRGRDHARPGGLGQDRAAGRGGRMSVAGTARTQAAWRRADHGGADRRARDDSRRQRGFKGYLDQRRSANTFALDQGFEVALGGEAWAADSLRRDKQQSSKTDDFTEEWATPIPPIPIEGGEFEGQLEDMQGRFNLNSLVTLEGGELQGRQAGDRALRATAGDARARDEVGEDHRRLDRHRHRRRISRWRGRPDLHGPDAALSHGQHADHARQRAAGDRRLRPRALSQARAVRHRAADRHAHQSLHGVAGAARCARRRTAAVHAGAREH